MEQMRLPHVLPCLIYIRYFFAATSIPVPGLPAAGSLVAYALGSRADR